MHVKRSLLVTLAVCNALVAHAQPCRTDARLISSKAGYLQSVAADAQKRMVSLDSLIPGLRSDIRYATVNNFTRTILYHRPFLCLRSGPAYALRQVQAELHAKGLALKLFDAYRPFSVTCFMWKLVPDKRYAANPREGSNHNRGVAVDITVVDERTGGELDMGTAYDSFTDTAHHSFKALPAQVLANRRMLKAVMRKYGFDIVPDEWWHYQWKDKARYEVLDISFDDMRALLRR